MTDVLDLGVIDAPMLVFGGPYSNLRAVQAMRARADALGIPAARVICTGDVVAYAGEPAETVDAVMDWGCTTVMGNCEESLGLEADDCGCGFDAGTACDVLAREWYAFANAAISPAQRAWMRALPRTVTFETAGRRFAVVHGSAASINEFVFEYGDDAPKLRDLDALGVDAVIGGHAGVPFLQRFGARVWMNAGVIGMPANDGTPRVWFSLIRPVGDGVLRITLEPLDYDHAGAARAMREKRLPESYAKCLETGLWPNMDVMPADERLNAGRAISPIDFHWLARASRAAT